jgi:hypothetical protein
MKKTNALTKQIRTSNSGDKMKKDIGSTNKQQADHLREPECPGWKRGSGIETRNFNDFPLFPLAYHFP